MDSEPVEMPLDYLQGHKDGLEWAAQLAESNHPETGDWLYDDPIELAKAIRKGPDMPPAQPVADSEPDCKERKLFCSTDTARMRKVISVSAGTDVAQPYRHAQPAPVVPVVPVVPDFKKLARELVDNLVDCGGLDEGVKEKYLEWAEKTCRAAMLQAGALTNEDTKQSWTGIPDIDNAINMLDRIDTLESCDDDRIEAVKTVLRGLAGWIPVSERMPGRYYVLAADFSGRHYPPSQPNTQVGIHDDWFGDGKPTWDDGDGNDLHLKQVTHWMPLPAAPQEVR
ncbi:DUF551 domain-containing protein [Klebsiella pneumoniae]